MPHTNVELSKNELDLVTSSEFILTKNRIIEKVYTLFGNLSEDYKNILNGYADIFPVEIFSASPKIYKGENYLSLPYVMMDYPRIFLKEDAFAIRSFFWWGNYFSLTLQLSGKFLEKFIITLTLNLKNNLNVQYFVCINSSPWQHHFDQTNYKPLEEINTDELFSKPFLKIAVKLPLYDWNNGEKFFKKNYTDFLNLLQE